MKPRDILAALMLLAALAPLPGRAAEGQPAVRSESVSFADRATSVRLKGSIQGSAAVDYRVSGRAGQTLSVTMKSSNASAYFNVLPPGSEAAMFIGSSQGSDAHLVLPADGEHVVRVYLMRNAARRNETARYTLDIGIGGQPLAPLGAAQDATIAGTAFHAAATVACQPPGADAGGRCQALVTRRGRDGTATVELRGANGLLRRVLFVNGTAVASDSPEALSATRTGDFVAVRIGADERYDIPDALLTGG